MQHMHNVAQYCNCPRLLTASLSLLDSASSAALSVGVWRVQFVSAQTYNQTASAAWVITD